PEHVTSETFTVGPNVTPPSVDRRKARARPRKTCGNCSQATFTSPDGPTTTWEPCTNVSMPHTESRTTGADQVAPPSAERTSSIDAGKSLTQPGSELKLPKSV